MSPLLPFDIILKSLKEKIKMEKVKFIRAHIIYKYNI